MKTIYLERHTVHYTMLMHMPLDRGAAIEGAEVAVAIEPCGLKGDPKALLPHRTTTVL